MPNKLTTCPNCGWRVTPVDHVVNQFGIVVNFWGKLVCPHCHTTISVIKP